MEISENIQETLDTGVIVKERLQGTQIKRPDIVVLFSAPASRKVHTGFGTESFDLYMTPETRKCIDVVEGHGRLFEVSDVILASLIQGVHADQNLIGDKSLILMKLPPQPQKSKNFQNQVYL